jgi:hypothetical protein
MPWRRITDRPVGLQNRHYDTGHPATAQALACAHEPHRNLRDCPGVMRPHTRQAHRRGVNMQLVRVWRAASKDVEYAVKRTIGGPGAFCPLCRTTPLDEP